MSATSQVDTLVIGGGVVGMSVAYGLGRAGERVQVLDEGDEAYRAARGNFGLVWVQGKGLGQPDYARWTLQAAAQWPAFAAELARRSGVEVDLAQPGGLIMCLDDAELSARAALLGRLRDELDGDYPFSVLDGDAVRRLIPQTGPAVAGAVMCPLDGHVSPLRLLRALVQAFEGLGGRLRAGARVEAIQCRAGGFDVRAGGSAWFARKLVLAAGLGNRHLAPMVGLKAPVQPSRGQILVTERVQPFLRHPTLHVRQTGEGVL
ncbi:MAG: FAD-binding oxidoreductase, partial [Burkholderiales bacterium]|nr:FAD-binding oxidoreductase [Burkholderiales bacterium]